MAIFQRGLWIMVFTLLSVIMLLVAAAVRVPRLPDPDLSGRLAFLLGDGCEAAHCAQIGVVQGDGYRPIPLPFEPLAFAWSPDETRLAFIGRERAEEDAAQLYVARADGSEPTPITTLHFLDAFAWSPDGRFLTYSYTREGDSGIYRIAADGTGYTRLINGFVSMTPLWSPDGAWIMFQVRGFQGQQIYLVDPQTGRIRNLTGDSAYDYSPRWSPDGQQIVFLSRDRARTFSTTGVPLTQAFVMDRRGADLRQITRIYGNVFGVEWSPGGDMLAFYVAEARTELPFWGNLYVLDIAHNISLQVTDSTSTNSIGDFAWSPDGARLAYVLSPLQNSRVCVQALGGRAQCVAGDRARKSDVRWISGSPLPEFPMPTPTPPPTIDPLMLPGGVRLE